MKEENSELRILHKISQGETLENIAFMYETSSEKIIELNEISESLDNMIGEEIVVSEFPSYYLSEANYEYTYNPSSPGESSVASNQVVLPIDAPDFVTVDGICFHRTGGQAPFEEIRNDFSGDYNSCEDCIPTPTLTSTPTPTPMTPTITMTMTCRWTQTIFANLNDSKNDITTDWGTFSNFSGSRIITHDSKATDDESTVSVIYDIDSTSNNLAYNLSHSFENYITYGISYDGNTFCYTDSSTNKSGAKKWDSSQSSWENLFNEVDSPYISMSKDGKTFAYFNSSDYNSNNQTSSKIQIIRFEGNNPPQENNYEITEPCGKQSIIFNFDGSFIFFSDLNKSQVFHHEVEGTSGFKYVQKFQTTQNNSTIGDFSFDGNSLIIAGNSNTTTGSSKFYDRVLSAQDANSTSYTYEERLNSSSDSPPSKLSINFSGSNYNQVMSCDGRVITSPSFKLNPGFLTVYNYTNNVWNPEPCSWQGQESFEFFGQLGSFNSLGDIYFALTADNISAFSYIPSGSLKDFITNRAASPAVTFNIEASLYSGSFSGISLSGGHRINYISESLGNEKDATILIHTGDTLKISNNIDNSKIYISKSTDKTDVVNNSSNQGAIKNQEVSWTPDGTEPTDQYKNFYYYLIESTDTNSGWDVKYGKIIVV